MAKRFTPEQERILNEWARTASELRRAFPYTTASDTQTKGFGYHLNKEVDPNGRFYIEVRQSDGLVVNPVTSVITFSSQDFYLEETSNPNEILVNSRGGGGGSGSSVTDHGGLSGLGDDDHTQYLLASDAGSRAAFAANWTDLTDGGETTLHTHDHGGLNGLGDDDHPQYLLRTEAGLFYGIVVKESDNSYISRDDTIVFTSSDFNVADGVDGKPTVTIVDSGIDHGSLGGLGDDDHIQYLLVNAGRAATHDFTFRRRVTAQGFYTTGIDIASGTITVSTSVNASVSMSAPTITATTLRAGAGSVTVPSIAFSADQNTGIYSPIADELAVTTGGVQRLLVGRDGVRASDRVEAEAFYLTQGGEVFAYGFNREHFYVTPSKSNIGRYVVNLDIEPGSIVVDHGGLSGLADDDHPQYARKEADWNTFRQGITAEAFYLAGASNIYASGDNTIIDGGTGYVQVFPNFIAGDPGSEGDGINVGGTTFASALKVSDIDVDNPVDLHIHKHSATGPAILIASRSDALGATHADVDDGDSLFSIWATGREDGTYEVASKIETLVDGTPAPGYVPGRINFRVNDGTDTSLVPALAMSIRSTGHVKMENTLSVKNQVTAEAFYTNSSGEVRPWDVNPSHFYLSQDSDGTSIINLKHETFTKAITLQNPSNFDTITWWVEPEETEVVKLTAFLRTEDSGFYPFCDFTVRYGVYPPSRGSGTELEVGGWRAGFYTGHAGTGENPVRRSIFDNSIIPQDNFVWLETLKLGEGDGKEEELHVTLQLRKN